MMNWSPRSMALVFYDDGAIPLPGGHMTLFDRFIRDCRQNADSVLSACVDLPVDMGEELLNVVGDLSEDCFGAIDPLEASAVEPIRKAWDDLYASAASYLSDSERIDECILVVGQPLVERAEPLEVTQAFKDFHIAVEQAVSLVRRPSI